MKIGVIGDTHKETQYIDEAIEYLKDCDLILHTGDNFFDSSYIYKVTNINTIGVKGNCDFEDVEDEIIFEIEEFKIFLCHGHKYDVKRGIEDIKKKAHNIKADIVIFGHSHEFINTVEDEILFLNPGSTSFPRKSQRSFVILDIENKNIQVNQIML